MSEHGTYCCETCRAEGWRCPAPCARPCCAATQPEQGTASVEALLAQMQRKHRLVTVGHVYDSCICGWYGLDHPAHVASAQAAALAGMLPVGTVREEGDDLYGMELDRRLSLERRLAAVLEVVETYESCGPKQQSTRDVLAAVRAAAEGEQA